MQIVIDISEPIFEEMITYHNPGWGVIKALHDAFINAVVLPKGHDRLIDSTAFLEKLNVIQYGMPYCAWRSMTIDEVEKFIDSAPTVLEADKESEVNE